MISLQLKKPEEYLFPIGAKGYFDNPENPLVVIGEDSTHVHTILTRSNSYYSVFKRP